MFRISVVVLAAVWFPVGVLHAETRCWATTKLVTSDPIEIHFDGKSFSPNYDFEVSAPPDSNGQCDWQVFTFHLVPTSSDSHYVEQDSAFYFHTMASRKLSQEKWALQEVDLHISEIMHPTALKVRGYATYDIYSDPPGAYVYGEDGGYWGRTSNEEPVARLWTCTAKSDFSYTVTLKKPGYKATAHPLPTKCKEYRSREDASKDHSNKMIVVLDPLR